MEPANQKKLQEHLQAIAEILYQETETEELESLAGIEKTIRAQTKRVHYARIRSFFLKEATELHREE